MLDPATDPRTTDPPALPPLKLDPRYGHFPRWPEDGDHWVHPEDVSLARQLIPSPRIWRRDGQHGIFAILHYGTIRLRVLPRMWLQTPRPAHEIGHWVEVRPRGMQNDPHTGRVRHLLWDDHTRQIHYQLEVAQHPLETRYTAADLKPIEPPQPQAMVRIEPRDDTRP